MKTITLAGRAVSMNAIERYVRHLHKQNEGSIGDPQTYEWMRGRLHNNIFLTAGFKDNRGIRARVIERDSEFDNELNHLLCEVMACPKEGHGTTDRKGFCFECGKFITAKTCIRTLHRIADEHKGR